MSIKAAPRTSLIQRGWDKCGRHISVKGFQLYNSLGIHLSIHVFDIEIRHLQKYTHWPKLGAASFMGDDMFTVAL
jgi:hypothetical protein